MAFMYPVDGTERVQRRDLDTATELLAALLEPAGVGGSGAAHDEVEQSGLHDRLAGVLRVGLAGQVDHPGQLLRSPLGRVDVVPHVLIHPEGGHPGEAGLVLGRGLQQRPDRAPHGRPARPELPGQAVDRGVLAAQLPDRPPARPDRQQRPRPGNLLVLLGERPDRAHRLKARPGPLEPADPDPTSEARGIDQLDRAPPVTTRHDPTRRATRQLPRGLHGHNQPGSYLFLNEQYVQPIQARE
jgi:hypothetical protein